MIDENFHLTPLDVRRYEFGRSLRGYDTERVDQFREQVADELDRLGRLNNELEAQTRTLTEELRTFRERDRAMNDALVSAQQLRADMKGQAEKESELVLREARAEAAKLLEDSRASIRRLEDECASIDRLRRGHLAQMRMYAERQLAEIAAAEAGNGADPSGRAG